MISLVIPVYNERESLAKLHAELSEVASSERLEVEFIFVDDGSTDGSWEAIRELANVDGRVGGVRFRRNFGKAAALRAGFDAARGSFVATLFEPGRIQLEADLIEAGETATELYAKMGSPLGRLA